MINAIKNKRPLSYILISCLSLLTMGCYISQIAPKVNLRLVTTPNRPLAEIKGECEIVRYPSMYEEPRKIAFKTNSQGEYVLKKQYVCSDVLSRMWCHFLNILLPHGYSGPSAVMELTMPKSIKLDPGPSCLTLNYVNTYKDFDGGTNYKFYYNHNKEYKDKNLDITTVYEYMEDHWILCIHFKKAQ